MSFLFYNLKFATLYKIVSNNTHNNIQTPHQKYQLLPLLPHFLSYPGMDYCTAHCYHIHGLPHHLHHNCLHMQLHHLLQLHHKQLRHHHLHLLHMQLHRPHLHYRHLQVHPLLQLHHKQLRHHHLHPLQLQLHRLHHLHMQVLHLHHLHLLLLHNRYHLGLNNGIMLIQVNKMWNTAMAWQCSVKEWQVFLNLP